MLFKVEMVTTLPASVTKAEASMLKQREREYIHQLQRERKLRHIWCLVGNYANLSIFDVAEGEELHQLLSALPLYAFMQINVQPLCRHPSSVYGDDR